MKAELISKAYEVAKERYAEIGVDTEKVLKQLQDFHLSLHCWQADDVKGFEVQAGAMSGGIQSTGNFPGAARNIDELRQDPRLPAPRIRQQHLHKHNESVHPHARNDRRAFPPADRQRVCGSGRLCTRSRHNKRLHTGGRHGGGELYPGMGRRGRRAVSGNFHSPLDCPPDI